MTKVILVRHSEPISIDQDKPRLWRAGLIHKYLEACDDVDVRLFVSSYNHMSRKQRDPSISTDSIEIIKTIGYKSNISIRRLLDHAQFGIKTVMYLFKNKEAIDIAILSLPTVESAFLTLIYCKFRKIKVHVDLRDLWPDVFYDILPKRADWILRLALYPYKAMVNYCLRNADLVTGPTQQYCDWALDRGAKNILVLPLCYEHKESNNNNSKFLSSLNINSSDIVICFAGTIGRMFDFDTVIDAIKKVGTEYKFIICGLGESYYRVYDLLKEYDNVHFVGWLGHEELTEVFERADLALAPYKKIKNFNIHIPNKIIEYMAFSIPMAYTIDGPTDNLLKNVSFKYSNSNELSSIIKNKKYLNFGYRAELKRSFEDNYSASVIYKKYIREQVL